jgi:Restriction endonuclease
VRHLAALSDIEFERLVADLLAAEMGASYERFGVGPDGGIDLRRNGEEGVEVVQCKHYSRSSFSQLCAAAEREAAKLKRLDPAPERYRFVTSQSLTVGKKGKLMDALGGWIEDPALIWGAETIEDLLDIHPDVERRHVKLWLTSSAQLERLLNAATQNRSNDLIERVTYALPRYVHTGRFFDAQEMLEKEGVCLVAGEPGIGKTTLAQMLLLDSAGRGFEALHVSQDIGEAWEALADRPQAFYYDDFLGRVGLGLGKNEDQRLVDLIARAHRNPHQTRLILTTREYILRGAVQLYESLDRAELDHKRFLLALPDYSRYERGLVLYNHLYHSEVMKDSWIAKLVDSEAYIKIVDHKNYSPRLIEFITGHTKPRELERIDGDWLKFAFESLDHPAEIWKRAFEIDLTDLQRAMVLCLVSFGGPVDVEDLRAAVRGHCTAAGLSFSDSEFDRSLDVLELSFLSFGRAGQVPTADVANPSISDFVLNRLSFDARLLASLLDGATFFIQPLQLILVASKGSSEGIEERLSVLLREERERLARSLMATFKSPEIGGEGREADLESRLRVVLAACGDAPPAEGAEWLEGVAVELGDRWSKGKPEGKASVAAYRACLPLLSIRSAELLASSLKKGLRRSPMTVEDFEAVWMLRESAPDTIGVEERDRLVTGFEEFTYALLLRGALEESAIADVVRVATRLGAKVDDVVLEEARIKAYRRREREAKAYEKRQRLDWKETPRPAGKRSSSDVWYDHETVLKTESRAKLREIFGRLRPAPK